MKSLSVLIPTLLERRAMFNTLYNHLAMQVGNKEVRIVSDITGKPMSIGRKRQKMLQEAVTDYIVFVDDDDMVTHDYVEKVYNAIQSGPDVVGLCGYMTTNRQNPEDWIISIKYPEWKSDVDGFKYVRYPNHLAPVKREHALAAGFPDKTHGEDYDYSMSLKNTGLLKNEVLIDEKLYHYIFIPHKA